jgi:hypothetical protein
LWFTDGRFDIEPRQDGSTKAYAPGVGLGSDAGTEQAEAKGKTQICRAGGIADQLRAADILVLAEGLGTGPDQSGFAFLRGVATGRDGNGQTCGHATGAVVGEFDYAQDVDQLLFTFDAVGDPARPPADLSTGVCPTTMCAAQTKTFAVDSSIRSVHILAGATNPGIDVMLRGPGGAVRRFAAGTGQPSGTFSGAKITGRWLSGQTLDMTLSRGAVTEWSGDWHIAFVDPTPPVTGEHGRLQIRIIGDFVPSLLDAKTADFRTRTSVDLNLGVLSEQSGARIRPASLPPGVAVSAELRTADQTVVATTGAMGPDALAAAVPLSLMRAPVGAATLRLTLTNRIGTSAIRPTDSVVDVPIKVLPPLNFPDVSGSLDFRGKREGVGPFGGALTITGPGCVWVGGSATSAAPESVGTATVTAVSAGSAATCQSVSAGATTTLPVQLSLGAAGTGTVAGKVAVHLAPTGRTADAVVTDVDFIADVVKPPVQSVRIAAFVVALLVGLGLPLVFLYVTKWWSARIPGRPLVTGIVPAELRDGSVTRDGRPFAVGRDDMEYVPVDSDGTRWLTLPHRGVTLTARMGLSPTAPGHVNVEVPGMKVSTGRLPLAVHDSWVVLEGAGRLEVLVLAPADANDAYYARLSDQIRDRLPGIAPAAASTSDLAQVAPPQGGGPPTAGGATNDWWGT